MLNPQKGLELDLKIVCNSKISNNMSLWTVNSNSALLGDTRICKTDQKQDLAPWCWSIGLPKQIVDSARWVNMLQNVM